MPIFDRFVLTPSDQLHITHADALWLAFYFIMCGLSLLSRFLCVIMTLFGTRLTSSVTLAGSIVMGLYRNNHEDKDAEDSQNYVATNPKGTAIIRRTDAMYLIPPVKPVSTVKTVLPFTKSERTVDAHGNLLSRKSSSTTSNKAWEAQ